MRNRGMVSGRLGLLASEDLARIHDAVRVGDPLYPAHERQRIAVFFLQVPGFSQADTVLAGAGAATLQGVVHDLGVDRLDPSLVGFVISVYGEDGVIIPVSNVAQDGPFEAAGLDGVAGVTQGAGEVGDRD